MYDCNRSNDYEDISKDTYRIRKNIGKELNLANCHAIAKFKLANIFSI